MKLREGRLGRWTRRHKRIHVFVHSTWCRAVGPLDRKRVATTGGAVTGGGGGAQPIDYIVEVYMGGLYQAPQGGPVLRYKTAAEALAQAQALADSLRVPVYIFEGQPGKEALETTVQPSPHTVAGPINAPVTPAQQAAFDAAAAYSNAQAGKPVLPPGAPNVISPVILAAQAAEAQTPGYQIRYALSMDGGGPLNATYDAGIIDQYEQLALVKLQLGMSLSEAISSTLAQLYADISSGRTLTAAMRADAFAK